MIHTTLDNFFLDDEALENSPSRRSGIDRDTENSLRHYGCDLIQEAGILLGFQQVVMATGQVLFQRFYCKRSMKEYNVKKLAATALWQGAKLEEAPEVSGHPRELLNKVMVTVDRCIARRETPEGRKLAVLDLHSKEAEEFRRSLIRYEMEMLKVFGFITHVEHPHKLLLNYIQILGLAKGMEHDESEFPGFVQEAWNIANDSLRTTLCVRFKSSIVACGIIFYVSRKLKVALPESPPWYDIFGVKASQIYDICATIHLLYATPRAQFIPVCHQILPSKPPTPATAGAAAGVVVEGATPAPMEGRPAKPLDPSVRVPVGDGGIAGATPGQANGAASSPPPGGVGGSTPAAAAGTTSNSPSAASSPQQQAAPGSAQKRRDRSNSWSPGAGDHRKRQRGDGSQPEQQQSQGHPQAADHPEQPASQELRRPPSRLSMRSRSRSRDRDRARMRDSKQGSRRSSRSRSRERGHPRSSSRGGSIGWGDGRYDRQPDKRDRDRQRGYHYSRIRDAGDSSRDRDRSRDTKDRREGDRRSGQRDRRENDRERRETADKYNREGAADKGLSHMSSSTRDPDHRESVHIGSERTERERSQDRKQGSKSEQPGSEFPPPPPMPTAGRSPSSTSGAATGEGRIEQRSAPEPAPAPVISQQKQQAGPSQGSSERGVEAIASPPVSAGSDKPTSPAAAVPPKPKPVARKKVGQQSTAATDKVAVSGDKPSGVS